MIVVGNDLRETLFNQNLNIDIFQYLDIRMHSKSMMVISTVIYSVLMTY